MPVLQVRKLSVIKVEQPLIFNSTKDPIPGGLYDPAMGPIDFRGRCTTCNLGYNACPGHFGRIELPVPVYNPLIFGWVRTTCASDAVQGVREPSAVLLVRHVRIMCLQRTCIGLPSLQCTHILQLNRLMLTMLVESLGPLHVCARAGRCTGCCGSSATAASASAWSATRWSGS